MNVPSRYLLEAENNFPFLKPWIRMKSWGSHGEALGPSGENFESR